MKDSDAQGVSNNEANPANCIANKPMAFGFCTLEQPKHLAREEAVLDAMGAFEALARHAIMQSRDDLTKTQVDILMRLSLYGRSNMTQIANDLSISKEHVTRAIATLVEKGLVEKYRNPQNQRLVEAEITEQGQAIAFSVRMRSIQKLNERLASISEEDRERLLAASETAAAIIRKIKMK